MTTVVIHWLSHCMDEWHWVYNSIFLPYKHPVHWNKQKHTPGFSPENEVSLVCVLEGWKIEIKLF